MAIREFIGILLFGIVLFLNSTISCASSLLEDGVNYLHLVTNRGDALTARMKEDRLVKLKVVVDGINTTIDTERYSDLRGAWLQSVRIWIDTDLGGGVFPRRLVIPMDSWRGHEYKELELAITIVAGKVTDERVLKDGDFEHPLYIIH